MRPVDTISSNVTSLLVAEEVTPGVLPSNLATDWRKMEPNEYNDFGAELTMVAREPISEDRQRKKGTTVGLSASGGWTQDYTARNMLWLLQGFMFASIRSKGKLAASAVLADGFTVASGGALFMAGTLLTVLGSSIPTNNGLKVASADGVSGKVNVAGLTAVAETVLLQRVGFQFPAGDVSIDMSGGLPALVSEDTDLTLLGAIPGEIGFLGGDAVGNQFSNTANKGYVRVLSVSTNRMVFDKTDALFVADDGDGKSVRIFFGEVLKNEKAALQVSRTYALRRRLGRPDLDDPGRVQSEVLLKSVANELSIAFATEDKITAEVGYMSGDYLTFEDDSEILGADVDPPEDDAINTANDLPRITMFVYPQNGANSAPVPLIGAVEELNLMINNNVSDNKALGKMGSFALTPGKFEVSGDLSAYFVDIGPLSASRNNADVTLMVAMWKQNRGVVIDLPMIGLSTQGLDVGSDDPIMLPIDTMAGTGRKYNANMDHTLLISTFDYLPDLAK